MKLEACPKIVVMPDMEKERRALFLSQLSGFRGRNRFRIGGLSPTQLVARSGNDPSQEDRPLHGSNRAPVGGVVPRWITVAWI